MKKILATLVLGLFLMTACDDGSAGSVVNIYDGKGPKPSYYATVVLKTYSREYSITTTTSKGEQKTYVVPQGLYEKLKVGDIIYFVERTTPQ